MAVQNETRDMVLPPGTYLFIQDGAKGQIKTFVGSTLVNITGQDFPVRFDENGEFKSCTLEQATQRCPVAREGDYVILDNPTVQLQNTHPAEGNNSSGVPALAMGRRLNIQGPATFALWPQQRAQVLEGHRLRSNEYLLLRVYNEEEAQELERCSCPQNVR